MINESSDQKAYIGLGSNLGDRAANLLLGIRGMLDAGLAVSRLSQVYETEPVETFAQPKFLNMVAELSLSAMSRINPSDAVSGGRDLKAVSSNNVLSAAEVMERLLQVELSLGRTRNVNKGPRSIDLDLLLCGNETSDTQLLTLPHPRLHLRRFVLVPLVELAPEFVHPTLRKTMAELLETLADRAEVSLWQT